MAVTITPVNPGPIPDTQVEAWGNVLLKMRQKMLGYTDSFVATIVADIDTLITDLYQTTGALAPTPSTGTKAPYTETNVSASTHIYKAGEWNAGPAGTKTARIA